MRNQKGNAELSLRDEVLSNHCRLHNQLMESKDDYASAKKVLKSVSKSLNEIDWSKIIDVTPDFVVAAVDNTGEVDPAADIKAVIPPAKFQALKKAGLI